MLNLDTHILIYLVEGSLKPRERAMVLQDDCGISEIVLWEIAKPHHLNRNDLSLEHAGPKAILQDLQNWSVGLDVCLNLKRLDFRSDPADEIISSTSLASEVPLLTRDRRILASKVVPLAV